MEGQIALVERGDCSFVSKVILEPTTSFSSIWTISSVAQVIKAQEAGAVGVIVADRVGFCLCLELVQTQTNQSGHIKFNFNNFFTSF